MESVSKPAKWAGRIFSALAVLPFLLASLMKFSGKPEIAQGFEQMGWPKTMILTIAILEITSALLYVLPPFSVLGAIMLTGFLGGAMATHLRIGQPVYLHVALGFLIWFGLFLREPRLRVLIPVRGNDCTFKRDITINRSPSEVFAYLKSLRNFQNWNPFLKTDPQCKLQYSGVDGQSGALVSWVGNKQTGTGEQEITRIIDGRRVDFELRFKKPFENTTNGAFEAESAGNGGTKVTWSMDGKALFPMTIFALFCNVDKMIGRQFEDGLKELKSLLEKK